MAGTDYSAAKVEDIVVAKWLTLADYYLLQARDSIVGLMNGARYGERDSNRVSPAAAPSKLMHWYQPEAPRLLGPDRRRMSRPWNQRAFLDRYLASLRPTGSDADVAGVWRDNGADQDLVVCVANTAYRGGTRSAIGLALSTRQDRRYTQVHRSGREADHSLPDIEILSLPALVGSSLDNLVSSLAHELAHAFDLGDEYEGSGLSGTHNVLEETDTVGQGQIEEDNNLVHHYTIRKPPGAHGVINIDRVKWTLWHRVALCSVLMADAVALGGGRLRVRVAPADRAKWDTDSMHNFEVYLRSRNINADLVNHPAPAGRWFLEGPLKILEIEADGSLILATTFAADFKKDDILYLPQIADGKPLTVFHPNVLFDLKTIEEPFAVKTDPTEPSTEPAYPPEHALGPDFKPRHAAFVVGLYEGGGTYNTRVYRASGACKMRRTRRTSIKEKPIRLDAAQGLIVGPEEFVTRFLPFCYVCRYSLVNTLDPTLLEGLPYPE